MAGMTDQKPTLDYATPQYGKRFWHWWDNVFLVLILFIIWAFVQDALFGRY